MREETMVRSRSRPTSATDLIDAICAAVVDRPGAVAPSVRRAAFSGEEVPGEAAAYVDKVCRHAYKVTDADVEALQKAGWSDDAIFEVTVATALGAALSRRDRARRVMGA
jgi:alkylhydroperoxidase family enzyme